mmetsp:Transcript_2654/g.7371  ORF Transcript_2654/g.7371 Transcript_2654/m.7371 type:complete len:103 (-) Transcript_2654:70-378(-)
MFARSTLHQSMRRGPTHAADVERMKVPRRAKWCEEVHSLLRQRLVFLPTIIVYVSTSFDVLAAFDPSSSHLIPSLAPAQASTSFVTVCDLWVMMCCGVVDAS